MTEPVTLEHAIVKANDLRSRVQAGETIPKEELREALTNLRAGRSAATASKKAAAKAPAAPIDIAALFSTPTAAGTKDA